MKKFIPVILFIIHTGILYAQSPVITEANFPQAGESYAGEYDYNFTSQFNVGSKGASQTWDFSGISASSATIAYENPTSNAQGASFPTSNLTMGYMGNYIFYNTSSTHVDIVGTYFNSMTYPYTSPQTIIKFPLNYTDKFKDTAKTALYDISGGNKQIRTTFSSTEADGYGSIQLPGGQSYSNVLRVRVVSRSIDSTFNASLVYQGFNTVIDSQYYWIAPDKKPHVFSALKHTDYSQQPSFLQNIVVYQYFDAPLFTKINKATSSIVKIYPNPANNILMIDMSENIQSSNQITFSLTSSEGKEILNETLNESSNQIQLQKAKPGLYIYHLKKGDEILESGKITIQ